MSLQVKQWSNLSLSYHYMQLPREVIVGNGTLNRVPEVVRRLDH